MTSDLKHVIFLDTLTQEWSAVHRGATYQLTLKDRPGPFSACLKTIEGQRATKIRLARKEFLNVVERDLS